ncbi:MAG: hypothetical protein NC921_03330, partial [Candidatus Omnitrophica bacterium]|nr:hypothetical protein [Candidatus Omnitrophota bacterium]
WEQVNITPDKPVCLCGQFHARVSEGVKDPITSTILIIDKDKDYVIWISCDLVAIPFEFKKSIVEQAKKILPNIDETKIIINATHTHTAPEPGGDVIRGTEAKSIREIYGIDLPVMEIKEYIEFAAEKIAVGIKNAWKNKKESGIGYGIGFAVVGRNRRVSYYDGHSQMYGKTDDLDFSHIEGYEDHSLNIMATFDREEKLTGFVVNLACPSQVSESEFLISADFWSETRNELRKRFGEDIFVLAQCSSAGDQSPHILINKKGEERMLKLSGRTEREEISIRIADGIEKILPFIKREISFAPIFSYIYKKVPLSRRKITEEELNFYLKEAEKHYKEYERLKKELEENPEKRREKRWYVPITYNYRRAQWFMSVKDKFERQKINPKIEIVLHILRLGDIVFVTNPFELYLDYGIQIKARSKAIQTFVVQLTGPGTYLPTARSVKGGGYGSVSPSNIVGPEGGRELVEETIKLIEELFK